jgi:hypothetical protein
MPIPPSQWVIALQKSREQGRISTSAKTVAPVVVNPEALSKTALGKSGSAPEKRKGKAPRRQDKTQAKHTRSRPWGTDRRPASAAQVSIFPVRSTSGRDMKRPIPKDRAKEKAVLPSRFAAAIIREGIIARLVRPIILDRKYRKTKTPLRLERFFFISLGRKIFPTPFRRRVWR